MTDRREPVVTAVYFSPLGEVLLAAQGEALIGCWFVGQRYEGRGLTGEYGRGSLPVLDEAALWLDAYFAGKPLPGCPRLAPKGTAFQLAVWQLLAEIPYGETTTYSRLAQLLSQRRGGRPSSARAVGGAVSRNPLSLFLPCHRVLGANGSLTGYAGGTERKAALLRLEKKRASESSPAEHEFRRIIQ
ncbi:MAG: methylated-DNA--[protein]-cysteine S-methyltransferase [Oscillospiraceae bacterium]|nr:methylated-DNA--[protein]-cysteine S-methyltransferase [Oscillospiraceae bacterium]